MLGFLPTLQPKFLKLEEHNRPVEGPKDILLKSPLSHNVSYFQSPLYTLHSRTHSQWERSSPGLSFLRALRKEVDSNTYTRACFGP